VGFLLAAAAFTIMNHLMVGLVIWLARGENLMRSGVFNILTLMIDFASFGMGIASGLIWLINPYAVVFILSPLYLIYTTLQVPSLQHQTRIEPKTGLYNTRFFSETLQSELERADKFDRPLTIVMADVDLLRNINNNYGHLAGDTVLIGIADTLRGFVRDYDIVARFGGEEYAILMPETTLHQALPLVEKLRNTIAQARFEVSTSVTPLGATMSFGVAEREFQGQTAEQIIHNADLAVYRSKSTTRNRVCYYQDGEICDYSQGEPPRTQGADPGNQGTEHGQYGPIAEQLSQLTSKSRLHPINESEVQPHSGGTQAQSAPFKPYPSLRAAEAADASTQALKEKTHQSKVADKGVIHTPKPEWYTNLYVMGLALVTTALLFWTFTFDIATDWFGILTFVVIALITEWLAIDIYARNTSISTSVAPLITCACLFGAEGALVISLALAAAAMIKHHSPFIRFLFNLSNHLLAGLLCVSFLYWTGLTVTDDTSLLTALGVIAGAGLTYVSTTLLMAGVIHLSNGIPAREVWLERFYWLWPYYLSLGLVAYALAIGYLNSGIIGVIIFFVPLLMLRISQNQYLSRTESIVAQLRSANMELVERSNVISAMNDGLILALSNASDLRDPYVRGHAQHVARYAMLIAEEMGIREERTKSIQQAALLHDIGKIGIPEAILAKPSRLTADEYHLMKQHAVLGAALVQEIESLQHLAPLIRYHHEHYDGRGYPDGLIGADIPLESRILGVADAVEAMASDRPYRQALDAKSILAELRKHSGTQFDPQVVHAFTKVIEAQGETLICNSARNISQVIEQEEIEFGTTTPHTESYSPVSQTVNSFHSELESMNIALQRAIAAHRRMEVSAQEGRDLAETLLKVASTINMTLDQDRVLTLILEQLAYVMDYDNASIMLLDGELLNSVARRSIHVPESQSLSVPVQRLMHVQEVIEQKRPMVISDTHNDPRWMRRAGSENIRCWLGIPLLVQNRIIGLMNLSNGVPAYYTERHVQVATAFAAHAAIAIENARLFTQAQDELAERQRAEEALRQSQEHLQERVIELQIAKAAEEKQRELAETLSDAAHALNSSLSLQEVLSTILTYLGRVVFSDSIAVKLLSNNTSDLLAYRTEKYQDWQFTKHHYDLLPLEKVAVEKQGPVVVSDTNSESLWTAVAGAEHVRSWLGVPLMVQDTVVGLLTMTKREAYYYTDADVRLVAAFANQAAIAITNARLYEQVQEELVERMRAQRELQEERALLAQRVEERTCELKEANEQLTSALRTKDEFLATMSHELRTPLNAIMLLSESMQNGVYGTVEERQIGVLDNVKQSARHLLSLINDILDMSKIEAGMFDLDIGPVSAAAICRNSLQIVEESARSKGIELVRNFSPEIGNVAGDERRLAQILVNLLSNAIKFTPDGGKVGLDVTVDDEHGMVNFAVWDTGIGISQENMKRLFQPFVQLDSKLSRLYEGTGLGLALVDRLTKLHGGNVTLESEVDKGSRFCVSIPREDSEEEDFMALAMNLLENARKAKPESNHTPPAPQKDVEVTAEEETVATPAAAATSSQTEEGTTNGALSDEEWLASISRTSFDLSHSAEHNGTAPNHQVNHHGTNGVSGSNPVNKAQAGQPVVLLVEDNEIGLEAMYDYLAANHYQIVVARNGEESIALATQHHPDIILMDIQMPDMDGLEATRRIREHTELTDIPIIALTALAMPGDRERCLQAGVDEYLSKPVSMKHLLEVMSIQLQREVLQPN
ncbi:MAG: diguanylate cyclase, partial [Caldilineaceae bacterium]|nr:diguanylate cyclase [Caldilineaceae bacterium]